MEVLLCQNFSSTFLTFFFLTFKVFPTINSLRANPGKLPVLLRRQTLQFSEKCARWQRAPARPLSVYEEKTAPRTGIGLLKPQYKELTLKGNLSKKKKHYVRDDTQFLNQGLQKHTSSKVPLKNAHHLPTLHYLFIRTFSYFA